ncbi:MAG: cell division protein FtsQ/DivIB [Hyphomicrobiales bacterium]|nr:cell division protein FtsQ/DivIB [Hyphomicrobiales bacterium]
MTRRGAGIGMAVCLLLATGAYGSIRGGSFERFLDANGSVGDIIARGFGFGVDVITISGQRELLSTEVLKIAGIRSQDSLLFLDVKAIRERLVASPIIQTANVRKLYPNQLVIAIGERTADALWQRDGEVLIIAADGRVIDKMRDQRYTRLPFMVGTGANKRYGEYMRVLAAAGPLKSHIRAGTLIGERRWTVKFRNGLDLNLPEHAPEQAMARFVALNKQYDLLDRDILVADMRVTGRFVARLSEEAKSKREAAEKKRPKRKGGAA